MSIRLGVHVDSRELAALGDKRLRGAFVRAMQKAGSTALRDMKSEANKRVRARKRIKVKFISRSFHLRRPRGSGNVIDGKEWALDVRGNRVSLTAYPHRQTKIPKGPQSRRSKRPGGVSVEVNRGKRTLIKGAFIATMKSGHQGVWIRQGAGRLPIRELLASRPVDALLHKGEAEGVSERGGRSFGATFTRLLPMELDKVKAKGGGAG